MFDQLMHFRSNLSDRYRFDILGQFFKATFGYQPKVHGESLYNPPRVIGIGFSHDYLPLNLF